MAKFKLGKLLGIGSIMPRTGFKSSTFTGFKAGDFSTGCASYRLRRRSGRRRRRSW